MSDDNLKTDTGNVSFLNNVNVI